MKKIIDTIIFIVAPFLMVWGQGAPGDLPNDIKTASQTVSPTSSQNYAITYTYREPKSSHSTSLKTGEVSPVIEYFDGLGRPLETVAVKASQLGKDMVSYHTYDDYGRAEKEYLSYAKSSNYGAFVTGGNFTSEQSSFLSGVYGSTDGTKGYAQTQYESSPLNRVKKQGAPGADWQVTTNPVEYNYRTNLSTESVKTWKYSGDSYSLHTYDPGKLYVTETLDEDNKKVTEYTDFEGKLVQKEMNGAKTRYCYDKFGLLRCVIQPMGTSPASTDFCFYYKYDHKKRLTDKRVPGSGWIYYIYDARNRHVLTQDANQRAKTPDEWTYSVYDDLNRVTETGTWATSTTRSTLVSTLASVSNLDYISNVSGKNPLKRLHYNNYTGRPSGNAYHTADASTVGVTQATNNTGRLTWTETKALNYEADMDYWITSAIYYDKFGRIIQTVSDNHLGGKDYITNGYNFTGQVVRTYHRHVAGGTTTILDQYNDYDHRGRLMKVRHKINGANEKIVAAYSYDETGQLIDKYLHSESGGAFLQRNDYKYNIRGWLTEINNPSAFSQNDKFGLRLYYNGGESYSDEMYNGNIAGMLWGTPNFSSNFYTFAYDGNNRLTEGDFQAVGNALDVNYAYDQNGNLTSLERYDYLGDYIDRLNIQYTGNRINLMTDYAGDVAGVTNYPGSTSQIGGFSYDGNGNLTQETNKMMNFSYNLLNLPREVNYWAGPNKKIHYFYTFDGEKVRQTVEDNGTLTKTDYCGPFVYETVSGVRSLKYFVTPEGRAVKNGSSWDYEYNLTDHLGNVRAVIRKGSNGLAELIQQKHYYPFGMEMSQLNLGTGNNKYLYNGKEIQDDFDLNWYDYGARFYDPALARFHTQDRFAEKYLNFSPYQYAANNPILNIDINGDSVNVANLYAMENGEYLNSTQIKSFEVWASTKAGRQYILDHAQKGFELQGVYQTDLKIDTKSDGKSHSKGVDVSFGVKKQESSGNTNRQIGGDDRLKLAFDLDTYVPDTKQGLFSAVETWSHEVFIHGDHHEKKFLGQTPYSDVQNNQHILPFESTKYYNVGIETLQQAQRILNFNQVNTRDYIYYNVMLPNYNYNIKSRKDIKR